MKKANFFLLLLCGILLGILPGCQNPSKPDTSSEKPKIIATVFPGYDFARRIAGDFAEVDMLLPPGTESHAYEPTPRDIIQIQNCDLFIYVGGESDTWVEEILSSVSEKPAVFRLMDCVPLIEEDEEEDEYDEHVWTSPKNAVLIAQALGDAIAAQCSGYAETVRTNTEAFSAELEQLDRDFAQLAESVSKKVLIFGDRFPFLYLAKAYGFEYYAAFPGCSAETEPSAATMAFLIEKIRETQTNTVFYIEFSNHVIADGLAEATGAETALLHSCHNVTQAETDAGQTYITLMKQNLIALREALK